MRKKIIERFGIPGILILYFLLGFLWIFLTHRFLQSWLRPRVFGLPVHVFLEFLFVFAMAPVLYALFKPELDERRKISSALREANQFNMEIISSAVEGIVVYDREFRYVLWNPFMERMTGMKASQVLGRNAMDLFPHLKEFGIDHLLERALKGETVHSPETPFRAIPSGKTGWVSSAYGPHRDAEGAIIGVIGTIHEITGAKSAEEVKLQMAAIIENTSDLASIADVNGNLLYMNRAGREMLGIGKEDITKAKIRDFHLPGMAEMILSKGIPSALSGGVWHDETVFLARDGRQIPASQVIVSNKNRAGKVDFIATVARDITERKRAEEALKENEQKFKSVAEKSPNMIFINCRGRVVYANEKCEEIMGYQSEDFYAPGFNFESLIHPEDVPLVRKNFLEHQKGNDVAPYEYRLITRNGKTLDTILTTKLIDYQGGKAILGIVTDITERKRTEEKLSLSEKRFSSVFDLNPNPSAITEEDSGKIVDVNRAFCEWSGYSRPELAGRNTLELGIWVNPEERIQFTEAVHSGARMEKKEVQLRNRQGETEWFLFSACRLILNGREYIYSTAEDITERKRAEELMRESEEKFRQIFDHMSSCVAVYQAVNGGQDFIFTDFNRSAEACERIMKEDVFGKSVLELFPAVKEFGLFEVFQRVWRTGQAEFFPLKLYEDDRLTGWRENYICKLPNGNVVAIYDDITARRQAEEALKKNEENLSMLFENMAEGVALHEMVFDGKGCPVDYRIVNVNKQYETILGLRRDQVVGRLATEAYRVAEPPFLDVYAKVLTTGVSVRFDACFVPFEKHFDISVSKWGPNGFATIFTDVTARKRAEDALRESEERFQQVASSAEEMIWETDEKGLYRYVSEVSGKIIGYAPEELVGKKHFYDLFIPEDREKLKETAFEEFKRQESFRHFVNGNLHKNGSIVIVETSGSPLKDAKGNLLGYRGVDMDITQRIRAEKAILELNASLEQKVSERTRQLEEVVKELEAFSYSASHDLRAPLRAMNGFANALLEDYAGKLDVQGQRYLNLISSGAKNMGRLIDDLLAFSHMGRREIAYGNVDMQSLAGAVIEELKALVSDRAVEWVFPPLAACTGDASMLRQVWMNLLANAVKFTRPKNPARIEIGSEKKGNEVLYYVKDNGVGFDMQYSEKLFKVFQRLHSPGEFEGTGVGLAVVQLVVQRHGGKIWADGREGIGADFYFTLPAVKEAGKS